MKNHKSKILALCITSALLYGCGSDSDDSSSSTMEVQAYDGPVRGMIANYSCDDGSTGSSKATDDDGMAVLSGTFADAPETCSVTYKGNSDAVDMENGRDMSGVTYSAPKGLFSKGEPATVSPLTSIIAKQLDGEAYNESTAAEVLASLGLDEIANNGISIKELLSDTGSAVEKLKNSNKALFSKLAATKMILSDAVSALPDADPAKIASVTKKLSEALVKSNPDFPMNNSGKEIVVNLKEKLAEPGFADKVESGEISAGDIEQALKDNTADATKPEPTDPETPPATGGTGGTGGSGSTGTGA